MTQKGGSIAVKRKKLLKTTKMMEKKVLDKLKYLRDAVNMMSEDLSILRDGRT